MDGSDQLKRIDRATLTPVVRRALGEDAEIADWRARSLADNLFRQTEGIYRVSGTARLGADLKPWSLVLKVIRPLLAEDPLVEGTRRELDAYRSGLLGDLSGGLRAPEYYGLDHRDDGFIWLWLEEVEDVFGGNWPLSRYHLAARHLGQFNGEYLTAKPVPTASWLSRDVFESWPDIYERAYRRYPSIRHEPLARRVWPDDVAEGTLRLWAERGMFSDALRRLPKTFCHLDAFKRNLLARQGSDGSDETVAIDWAFAGIGAIGAELAPLVTATVALWEVDLASIRELSEATMDGYLAGLRDVGWAGDPRTVRLGYAVASIVRYAVTCFPVLAVEDGPRQMLERFSGHPIGETCDRWAEVQRFHLKLAEEARELLGLVG